MNISEAILSLTAYGLTKGLIKPEDKTYVINRYLEILKEDAIEDMPLLPETIDLPEVLDTLCDIAYNKGLMPDDGITERDLFDTKLMGVLTDRPSHIASHFKALYEKSPIEATDWFYDFSCNTNYIRRDRIKKDKRWKVDCAYGTLDITINLSKPEKDPKAIAAAKNAAQTAYPKCQLCMENEGYAGRINHPARQNHRIIPIRIVGQNWGFQYSPYVYYNEHCIVFNGQHVPMKIDRVAFEKLFSFVEQFPHYFLGSNADLPIVGGSILSHDHFQGGHYEFAMERAAIEKEICIPGYEDVKAGIVHWPLSVIRISHKDHKKLVDLASHILSVWRGYTDEAAYIFAETEGEPHNTITPIARKRGEAYELDLVLRNNITTKDCPLGLYHPHSQYHHIKKENIGLIEVMGLAVLPARLDKEMALLKVCLLTGKDLFSYPELEKHAEWAGMIKDKYPDLSEENIDAVINEEIGQVFVKVLEDAGVYKCNEEGRKAFDRFIATL